MSSKLIFQISTLACAMVTTVSAQTSTTESFPSITTTSNTTNPLPTATPTLSSTSFTNTTLTTCPTCTFPPCTDQTASYASSTIQPYLNTTTSSSQQTLPPAISTYIPDVTTRIIVTKTADGVPAESRIPPSGTGCAGPVCSGLVSAATSRMQRLAGVLAPLAIVAGAFAVLL